MMDDTNANYFNTVKAFNDYWKNREKPCTEEEKFEKGTKSVNSGSKNIAFSFEYKKFCRWQLEIKPYVQQDGHILYPYQRHLLRHNDRK